MLCNCIRIGDYIEVAGLQRTPRPEEKLKSYATDRSRLRSQSGKQSVAASMTAYTTRAPLQLIDNPHIMSQNGRRTSARLADKEDAPIANGIGHGYEPVKQGQKSASSRRTKANGAKAGAKRKPGELPRFRI